MSSYGASGGTSLSADSGASLGDSITHGTGTERAPSGLARFFGVSPFHDRRGM